MRAACFYKKDTETVFLMTDPKYSIVRTKPYKRGGISLRLVSDGLVPDYAQHQNNVEKVRNNIAIKIFEQLEGGSDHGMTTASINVTA